MHEIDTISYGMSTSDLGELLVASSIKGVCAILIGSDHEELDVELAGRFPKANLIADEAVVHDDLAKVISLMDKTTNGLYLPLDMRSPHRAPSLALAPAIRSPWPFLVTASWAAWRSRGLPLGHRAQAGND